MHDEETTCVLDGNDFLARLYLRCGVVSDHHLGWIRSVFGLIFVRNSFIASNAEFG